MTQRKTFFFLPNNNEPLLTLGHAQGPVHQESLLSVRLSAVDHRVVGPEAQPVVGEEGEGVMGEEEQETEEGEEGADGLYVGPEHGEFDLCEGGIKGGVKGE